MAWRHLKDAPTDGTRILAWMHDDIRVVWFEKSKNFPGDKNGFNKWTTGSETCSGYDCGFNEALFIYWMPIPEPPFGCDPI